MNELEWLSKLKVGDKVIVKRGFVLGALPKSVGIVTRFTKNFIIVEFGGFEHKFRNDSGREANADYHSSTIYEATLEELKKVEELHYRSVFQNKLSSVSWADVPLEYVKRINDLIDPYMKTRVSK